MAWTFASAIVITILQIIFGGVSFWTLFEIIPVGLFCLRLAGATFKIKILCILEALPLVLWLIWDFMWGGWEYDWPHMIVFLVCAGLVCGIMIYENFFYMIVEKEERSKDEDS